MKPSKPGKPGKPSGKKPSKAAASVKRSDLMDTFHAASRLQAFEHAANEAGLESMLRGEGPFTVFAPTDRAFAKMSDSDREALFADSAVLSSFVSNHVVRARVRAPALGAVQSATSLSGQSLDIARDEAGYHVNEARVVKTSIRATNGVIHAIDKVLLSR